MSEEFKFQKFIRNGAVFQNDTDKEGNPYLDEEGNKRPSFNMNLGTIKYRLFPNTSDNPNAPIFDVCYDVKANTWQKKD